MHIESQGACLGDSVRAAGAVQTQLGLCCLERALSSAVEVPVGAATGISL